MRFLETLRWDGGDNAPCLAFVGAGGKTTAIFRLAKQLTHGKRPLAPRVWITTTTHLSEEQAAWGNFHVSEPTGRAGLDWATLPDGIVVFTGEKVGERVKSPSPIFLQTLFARAKRSNTPLLIEADGSRLHPVKAPAIHEPVIPAFVDHVFVLAGLSALGQPLEQVVHRLDEFCLLARSQRDGGLSSEHLQRVLSHPNGGGKGIPATASASVLLTQAVSDPLASMGAVLAESLLGAFSQVIVADFERDGDEVLGVWGRVAGIVLAAGGGIRFGAPKQLLDWSGKPFVVQVAETALRAGCDPVIVVTGAFREQVEAALEGLPVTFVHNPDWEKGQSTSVQAGLRRVGDVGAALFLLSDQPHLPRLLMRTLMDTHRVTLAPIVAPLVDEQRGNPVLFDRRTFPAFASIAGDKGGRALFSRYRVAWIPWVEPTAALDVDTPADYDRLLGLKDA